VPPKPARQGGHNCVPPGTVTRADIAVSIQGGHSYDHQGGHSYVPLTVIEPVLEPLTTTTSKQQAAASPLPPKEARSAISHEKEARAKPALRMHAAIDGVFDFYDRSGLQPNRIKRTEKRRAAIGGRLKYDGCSVERLKAAIEGAVRAVQDDVLDHPRWTTDIGKIVVDREHVDAFVEYGVTGDPDVLSDMLLSEQPKEAA
jgi:hypothetical protein